MVPQFQGYVIPTCDLISQASEKEQQWPSKVDELLNNNHFGKNDCISWAAYHTKLYNLQEFSQKQV